MSTVLGPGTIVNIGYGLGLTVKIHIVGLGLTSGGIEPAICSIRAASSSHYATA